jgi:hypothetical protein
MARRILCLGLVGLVCAPFPASVAAADITTVATFDPDAAEAGFRLHGSHGYSISVFAYSEGSGDRGEIEFFVGRHDAGAVYRASAIVTADTVRADLGSLGTVDVVRRPSGREKTVHPKCSGGAQTYEPATYEGVIEFNGEGGYTRARKRRVAQLPLFLIFSPVCGGGGYGEVSGPGEPGARLRGISFMHGRTLSFQVNKNSPRSRTVFMASLKERRDGIWIHRELTGTAPPSAFHFDSHLRTAVLSPGAPFSGSASLSRSRNSSSPIWVGDLRLDFPGRAVSLSGPGVHVSLAHARFTRSPDANVEIGS